MSEKMLKPGRDLLLRIREAFLGHGYDGLSMVTLAKACGFTRRSLYNYFNNKEDAFRALIRFDNIDFIQSGLEAGERVRRRGGGALDILAETMDVRYGYARRILSHSPHAVELTAEVQRRCRDWLDHYGPAAMGLVRPMMPIAMPPPLGHGLAKTCPDTNLAKMQPTSTMCQS